MGVITQCCTPGAGKSPTAVASSVQFSEPPAAPFSLPLPACIKQGNCSLNDLIATGAQFANMLIQVSGAVFLAIFVYGGFLYLTAGASKRAAEGKDVLVKSAIGLVLLFASFTLIQFLQSALISGVSGGGQQETCSATPGYQCAYLAASPNDPAAISKEATERGCTRGKDKCPGGAANYVCCPTTQ
jgi:hypothetical protein